MTSPVPTRCPLCGSPDPARHPAVQHEGEVQLCRSGWHTPGAVCPATSPSSGVPCGLADTAEAHVHGHEGYREPDGWSAVVSWATTPADLARWEAANEAVVHHLPTTRMTATGAPERVIDVDPGGPQPLTAFAGRVAYGRPGNLAANQAEATEMARIGMNLAVYFGNDADMVAALMAEAERRAAAWGMRPVQGLQSVWDDVVKRRITP